MSATEVRRRMASGEKWQELVPLPVAEAIKEIRGVERVKSIAEKHVPGHRKE